MQRGQRRKKQSNHELNPKYVNKLDTVSQKGSESGNQQVKLGGFDRFVLYGGSTIYFLLFLSYTYQMFLKGNVVGVETFITALFENGQYAVSSFLLFLFHIQILRSAKKAIQLRNERDVMNAEIKEDIAWSMLGFAVGYICTNSLWLIQIVIGVVMAFLFYKIYRFCKFSPQTIFRLVVIIFITNTIVTILDPEYVGADRFISIFAYVSYKFNGGVIFTIVSLSLLLGGLLKAIYEKGIWHVIKMFFKFLRWTLIKLFSLPLYFIGKKKNNKVNSAKDQLNTRTSKRFVQKEQSLETNENNQEKQELTQSTPAVNIEPATKLVDNEESKDESEEEFPVSGKYFQDTVQSSRVSRIVKSDASSGKKLKEIIRKIVKL